MCIDHIGISVANFEESKAFYAQALEPLGIDIVMEFDGWAGMGRAGKPAFWFGEGGAARGPIHIAFHAEDRGQVRQFHAAAVAAGGKDNGAPGIRAHYHPNYFGAFVIGPDGHNIEAVCHRPE